MISMFSSDFKSNAVPKPSTTKQENRATDTRSFVIQDRPQISRRILRESFNFIFDD